MAAEVKPTREQVIAEPAGPQLDAWVAVHVMGWEPREDERYTNNRTRQWSIPAKQLPRYSRDIRQAWAVVDEMARQKWNAIINDSERWRPPYTFEIQTGEAGGRGPGTPPFVFVCFERPGGINCARFARVDETHGAAAALAICKAALFAVGIDGDDGPSPSPLVSCEQDIFEWVSLPKERAARVGAIQKLLEAEGIYWNPL